ncbi:MAG: serine protease, partial [Janthinobacterium lividum]
MIEPLLLAVCRVSTYHGERRLTNASSFFFQRDHRLFLVTSRHVMIDDPSRHYPTRLQVELHTDAEDMAQSTGFSIPLYEDGKSLWRQGIDAGGEIDVAVIEIDRSALPEGAVYRAFGPANLLAPIDQVEVGSSLLIVGFPLGFHDTLHHMPVVRHAVIASSFGLRFKGEGYFLTDAR